jgi:hypothetical protein
VRKPEEKKLRADLGTDGRMMISWTVMQCNNLGPFGQDRDKWQAVVNTVMNLQVP